MTWSYIVAGNAVLVSEALRYGNLYVQSGESPALSNNESLYISSVARIYDIVIVDIDLSSDSSNIMVDIYSYPDDASNLTGALQLVGDSAPVNQNDRFIDQPSDFELYLLTDTAAAEAAISSSLRVVSKTAYSKDENAEIKFQHDASRLLTQAGRSQIVKVTNRGGNNKSYSVITRWVEMGPNKKEL